MILHVIISINVNDFKSKKHRVLYQLGMNGRRYKAGISVCFKQVSEEQKEYIIRIGNREEKY